MSTAMGLSAVTSVLGSLLNEIYSNAQLGPIKVSARSPDLVQKDLAAPKAANLQVNLFLHQVTHNAAWRNMNHPWLAADGKTRLKNPPLALDLHYLLTVYANSECEAEALLGLGVQFMHENPVLARQDIRLNLAGFASNTNLLSLLGKVGLADQIEMIKITPSVLGREEMAWLWTALKADYRPTFPFQASVVLIQETNPVVTPLPVLTRNLTAEPGLVPPVPMLLQVLPLDGQPAASPGKAVTIKGLNLGAPLLSPPLSVTLTNAQRQCAISLPGNLIDPTTLQFTLPASAPQNPPPDVPAGIYLLSVHGKSGTNDVSTNSLPFAVAPTITQAPPGPVVRNAGIAEVAIGCSPYLRAEQEAYLLIGNQSSLLAGVLPKSIPPPNPAPQVPAFTATPSFWFTNMQPATGARVRLRVDGVDSPCINLLTNSPTFTGPTVDVT